MAELQRHARAVVLAPLEETASVAAAECTNPIMLAARSQRFSRPLVARLATARSLCTPPSDAVRVEFDIPHVTYNIDMPPDFTYVTKTEMLDMYTLMFKMRRMEIAGDTLYKSKFVKGFCHLYDGQEAIVIGMEAAQRGRSAPGSQRPLRSPSARGAGPRAQRCPTAPRGEPPLRGVPKWSRSLRRSGACRNSPIPPTCGPPGSDHLLTTLDHLWPNPDPSPNPNPNPEQAATTFNDSLITSYRDHCQQLARGDTVEGVLSELLGKAQGCAKGKGGSMHMYKVHTASQQMAWRLEPLV